MSILMQNYRGRKKITIPVSVEKFNQNPVLWILKYISSCVSDNNINTEEIEKLREIYTGHQSIELKSRLDGGTENNNKIIANHIWRQVEFKKGFMVGEPISYSNATANLNTDDMTYLKKFLRDSNKASKDITKYENLYIGGIAYTFTIPRQDNFDVKNESPFILKNLKQGQGFVVYSSDVLSEPLFNVVISDNIELNGKTPQKVYDIFYIKQEDGYCYNFTLKQGSLALNSGFNSDYTYFGSPVETQQTYKFLPVTEFELNSSRMGIVELVIELQDTLNMLKSKGVDNIVDFVDAYLVFENQNFSSDKAKQTYQDMKKQRVIALKTNNPQTPAKVSLLRNELNIQNVTSIYDETKSEMYDIVGAPTPSGNVTSGGDTGEARLLGNGWETAQNQAKVDINYICQFEYDLLKKMLYVCKTTIGNEIKEISASDIEIKYSLNMSNNLLIKAQSLKYLYDMNMAKEDALEMVNLTSDTHGVAVKWESNDNQVKNRDLEIELQKQNNNNNNNEKQEQIIS